MILLLSLRRHIECWCAAWKEKVGLQERINIAVRKF